MSTKDKVLEILTNNKGTSVSGEKLAETCGVSRAAIWKAMNSLRESGFQIEGTTNGGYILTNTCDVLSSEAIQAELKLSFPNQNVANVFCFKEIDSTNTYGKKILSEASDIYTLHKAVITAETQTAGKGRLGRTFVSPAKTGVYVSIIYTPKDGITEPALLTAFSAVAVCRVLKRIYDAEPKIKWINDIFVNSKKICGILTEGFTNFETGKIESAVVGIGINVLDNPELFQGEVSKVAGSILGNDESAKSKLNRNQLIAQISGEVLNIFEENPVDVIAEYKSLSFLIGKTIKVHPIIGDDKTIYEAKAVDIDEKAGLIVELQDGTIKTLSSGEVSLHSN